MLAVKLVKFVILFLMIDFTLGGVAKQIFFSQKSGKYSRITHAIEKASDEILIFGSSHANRHYVPAIVEKRLGESCYNVGVQGQGILFHSALQKIILERTRPKLIILNVDSYWLFESQKVYDRLIDLRPYYGNHHDILKPVLSLQSRCTDLKMLFKSYQTNSTILHAIKYYFFPQNDLDGYMPFNENKKNCVFSEYKTPGSNEEINLALDDHFIAAFASFIKNAKNKNIRMVIGVSPNYYGDDASTNRSMDVMRSIAVNEQIPWYDFSHDRHFKNKSEFFYDIDHLNSKGADLFTELFVAFLRADNILENAHYCGRCPGI